jgi:hypothetical protein
MMSPLRQSALHYGILVVYSYATPTFAICRLCSLWWYVLQVPRSEAAPPGQLAVLSARFKLAGVSIQLPVPSFPSLEPRTPGAQMQRHVSESARLVDFTRHMSSTMSREERDVNWSTALMPLDRANGFTLPKGACIGAKRHRQELLGAAIVLVTCKADTKQEVHHD